MGPVAWAFDFEAELELGSGHAREPSARARERRRALVEAAGLHRPGDVVLGFDDDARARGLQGLAWCPTPAALAALQRAGAIVPPAPSFEVLRRANHRATWADRLASWTRHPGPRGGFVTSLEQLREQVARRTPSGLWLLKRPYGFSGRGHRRLRAGALDPDVLRWLQVPLSRDGGVYVEPWVERLGDFAIHGFVGAADTIGEPCLQRTAPHGAWLGTERDRGELSAAERRELAETARNVAVELRLLGYFGPFGVDAFRYRMDATAAFNPCCDVNARYTMGWAAGLRDRRPDLDP